MSDLEQFVVDVVTKDKNARKVANAAKINQKLGDIAQNAGVDDGVSIPATPTGGSVIIQNRAFVIFFNPPAVADHVDTTEVWVGSAGGPGVGTSVYDKNVKQNNAVATGLTPGTSYQVWLRHTNIWARSSAWVQVGTSFTATGNVSGTGDSVDLANTTLINSLIADKITSGTITTAAITLGTVPGGATVTSGALQAFDTTVSATLPTMVLDSGGLSLRPTGGVFTNVADAKGAKITNPTGTPWVSIGFFNTGTGAGTWRGIQLKSTGLFGASSTSTNARIRMIAINDDTSGQDAAVDNFGAIIDLSDSFDTAGTASVDTISDRPTITARDLTRGLRVFGGIDIRDTGFTVQASAASSFLGNLSVSGNLTGGTNASGVITPGANYSNPAGVQMRAYRVGDIVTLQGQPQATAAVTSTDTICTLGGTFAPAQFVRQTVGTIPSGGNWTAQVRIGISVAGVVSLLAGNTMASGDRLSLDGISFSAVL